MPQHRQLRLRCRKVAFFRILARSEAEEMEHERIDGLVRKCVFLLKQDADEDVGRAGVFAADGALLGCDFAEAEEGGCGVQDRDADFRDHTADDVRFSEGAAVQDEGEEEAFEEGSGLVERLFKGVVEVDIKFTVFLDVLFDAVEENGRDEVLCCGGLRGDEDFGGGEGCVWCPGFGPGDG